MNNQQIEKIDIEIERLRNRLLEIQSFAILDKERYIIGEIDALKWVKENID